MHIKDDTLRNEALRRFEEEQEARSRMEALRFVLALFVGLVVFASLTAWHVK